MIYDRPKTVKCQLTKTCYYGIFEGHEKLINWSKQLVKYMPASTCDKFHQRQIYFFSFNRARPSRLLSKYRISHELWVSNIVVLVRNISDGKQWNLKRAKLFDVFMVVYSMFSAGTWGQICPVGKHSALLWVLTNHWRANICTHAITGLSASRVWKRFFTENSLPLDPLQRLSIFIIINSAVRKAQL